MKRVQVLPELLCPAGDLEALFAAVEAGADAVYVGGKRFGARALAKNFEDEELALAISYCHMMGVKLYVTVNTLIMEKELDEVVDYAERLYRMGADALIIADLGAVRAIRARVPGLALHASTQMGIHNTEGADFAAECGCERVVLARECSADDIEAITKKCRAECEIFVHGALCVCHSGQCLFSSLVGGRSGNRGECAQPCRLPYGKGYQLSLCDLSLARHIKRIISSGVSSLKIEGRMKSGEYVYGVTSIYRRLLDEGRDATDGEMRELERIFSRGGFTDGYYTRRLEKGMKGVRTEEDKRASRELAVHKFVPMRAKIKAVAELCLGKPALLTLTAPVQSRGDRECAVRYVSYTAYGEVCEPARSAPLDEQSVKQRLSRMGNTHFLLGPEDIELTLDDNVNLSPAAINSLRRAAAAGLEALYARPMKQLCPSEQARRAELFANESLVIPRLIAGDVKEGLNSDTPSYTAQFFSAEVAQTLVRRGAKLFDKLQVCFVPLFEYRALDNNTRALIKGVTLPPVIQEREWDGVRAELAAVKKAGVTHALISNIGHFALCKGEGLSLVADLRMNITNSLSKDFYRECGVEAFVLSAELNTSAARMIGGGITVLGRVPLMLTERCFIKDCYGCDKCGKASLTDRRGARFPIMREHEHRNIIFNSAITYMGDKQEELFGISHRHFIFSCETADECEALTSSYFAALPIEGAVRRVGKR